jgi:hypothetical protein
LSFCLGKLIPGYNSPAPFPATAPDGSVRDVSCKSGTKSAALPSLQAFYADKEKSSSEKGSSSDSSSSSDATSSTGSSSSSEDEDDTTSSGDDAHVTKHVVNAAAVHPSEAQKSAHSNASSLDKKNSSTLASLFAGLNASSSTDAVAPKESAAFSSSGSMLMMTASLELPVLPAPCFNILHFAKSHGLHIDACIPRSPSVYGCEFTVVRLTLSNQAQHHISSITVTGLVPGNEDVDGSGHLLLKTPAGISEL